MSLQRTDTGQTATPIAELEKRSNAYRDLTDNQLLKEALAKSNEKCNELMKEQNTLIEDLTEIVDETRSESYENTRRLIAHEETQTAELRKILEAERQVRSGIVRAVTDEVSSTLSDVKKHALKAVDDTVKTVQKQIDETARQIERQRHEREIQDDWQRLFFWATPILLLIQSIFLVLIYFQK